MFSLQTGDSRWASQRVLQRLQYLSHWLQSQGLRSGHILALSGNTQPDYLSLVLAAWQLGVITLPLNAKLKPEQLQTCHGLVAMSVGELKLNSNLHFDWCDLPTDVVPTPGDWVVPAVDQAVSLILTSGSSGLPKLVQHSWGNHLYSALGSAQTIPLNAEDTWHLALPLFHVGGLAIVVRCLLAGACVSLAGNDLSADLLAYQPTHLSLVATQLYRLLQDSSDLMVLKNARAILLGGSAIPETLIQTAYGHDLKIHTSYGSTEMASQIATTPPGADLETLMSVGYLLPHREQTFSAQSELWVRGKTLCQGYLDQTGLHSPLNAEGWFASGDVGYCDAEGRLHISGRRDNLIISGGENIQPETIEAQLLRHREVAEAIVVGVADAEFGQRPVAFVRTPVNEHALKAYLKQHLPGYAIPDSFYAMPDYQTLKPSRQELQQLAKKNAGSHKT